MKSVVEVFDLPFEEAVDYWKEKVSVDAKYFYSLRSDVRAKAFAVSGMKDISDIEYIYTQLQKSLEKGTTFKDFKDAVKDKFKKYGLSDKRIRNVFQTNIQTAFLAGKWKQIKDTAEDFPYLMYDAVNDNRTSKICISLDGKVYPVNHPFWETYYPPNHFGCRSNVRAYTEKMLEKRGLKVSEEMPTLKPDTGFEVNVGSSSFGGIVDYFSGQAEKGKWEDLGTKTFKDYKRPTATEIDSKHIKTVTPLLSYKDLIHKKLSENQIKEYYLKEFKKTIGGKESLLTDPLKNKVALSEFLFNHLKMNDGRMRYIHLIKDIIENPYEIWLTPMKNTQTGNVKIRKRYLKLYKDSKNRYMLLVAESKGAAWEGFTVITTTQYKYFNNLRKGRMLYGK